MPSEIPELAAERFDEKVLLDENFGSSCAEIRVNKSSVVSASSAMNGFSAKRAEAGYHAAVAQDLPEPRRPWYGELFKEALLSRESRFWLAFILIVAAVLTVNNSLVGKQNNAPKRHNWLTIQKGSLPIDNRRDSC